MVEKLLCEQHRMFRVPPKSFQLKVEKEKKHTDDALARFAVATIHPGKHVITHGSFTSPGWCRKQGLPLRTPLMDQSPGADKASWAMGEAVKLLS